MYTGKIKYLNKTKYIYIIYDPFMWPYVTTKLSINKFIYPYIPRIFLGRKRDNKKKIIWP